jgi:ubiquinone/menaquinone biosynthesis C-methylase UbiE
MNMTADYSRTPDKVMTAASTEISIFDTNGNNINQQVVSDFGQEWQKFYEFSDERIRVSAAEYFDILNEGIVNRQTYAIDIGCGTGRWTKYLAKQAGFIEAIDPSNAIFAAARLLNGLPNVRLAKASIETLPFEDETFDFAMSIGVLHHIPDTQQAMADCVKKVKKGGYFYVYLYYDLQDKGILFKVIFKLTDLLRLVISRFPTPLKKITCDLLAILIYMPLIYLARFLKFLGLNKIARLLPLHSYTNKSFYIVRNDALDRFGTRLEQRFSKQEMLTMMQNAGLAEIRISPGVPYYHAIGKKI